MTDTMSLQTNRPSPFRKLVYLKILPLAVIDLYAWSMLAFLLARAIAPLQERLWQISLLENIILWMLLPALPLLIAQLLLDRWLRVAPTALLSLIFLWNFGPFLLPKPQPAFACAAEDSCRDFVILTYNLLANHRADPQQQVDFLRASGADIIALQELRPTVAFLIDKQLADAYPYRVMHGLGIPGMGVLSRYPIRSEETIPLGFQRSYQRVEIDLGSQTLTLINAHLPRPGLSRGGYVPRSPEPMTELVAAATGGSPTVLVGDLNTTDQTPEYRLLAASPLHDAYRESGWGFGLTFPAAPQRWRWFPGLVRIDYVWHTHQLRAVRSWIGPAAGSDHLPLFAELVWTDTP